MRTFTQSLRYTLGALSAAAFCEVAIADITGRNDLARDDGAAAGRGTALDAVRFSFDLVGTRADDRPPVHANLSRSARDDSLEIAAQDYWDVAGDVRVGVLTSHAASLADGAKDWRWDNGAPVNFITMGLGHEAFISESMARRVSSRGLSFLTEHLELGGDEDAVHEVVPAPASAVGLSLAGFFLMGRRSSRKQGSQRRQMGNRIHCVNPST